MGKVEFLVSFYLKFKIKKNKTSFFDKIFTISEIFIWIASLNQQMAPYC